MNGYMILDVFFLIFHLAIVIFNLFGWMFRPTRKANLILLILTALSWFVLGLFYGIGFCPFTEWHWQVLAKLGTRPVETSYIQYLIRRLFSIHLRASLVDSATMISFSLAMVLSLIVNFRDYRRNKINI